MVPYQKALPHLVGSSSALAGLRHDIETAARSDAKILITGESGSGKEIVAQMIHAASRRQRAPMMAINCAAMAESLLETELFGHARGSFTGAYRDRSGIFETANGGTVFLDEIGETSPRMQGMLLRFLETGEVQRIGSEKPHIRVDVRIITATHRMLAECVETKTFRGDLYYRLNIVHLHVPPLREHAEDVPELLEFFLQQFSASYQVPVPVLTADAVAALCRCPWPGNVRELRNVVERVVSRGLTRDVTPADLPPEVRGRSESPSPLCGAPAGPNRADALLAAMLEQGQSFWTVVHEPFKRHDLTRDDVKAVLSEGLTRTLGSYRLLVELFNMPPRDYKRFLTFLHKHHCHLGFQQFRSAGPVGMSPELLPARPAPRSVASV